MESNTQIPRSLAAQYGQEAVQIIRQGVYRAPSGQMVNVADLIEHAVQGTISYPYGYHRARHDPLHTDYVIYSPAVPVFRADDGALLETPCTVGMITSPAVNAAALPPERRAEIGPAMGQRILKVFAAGIVHGHDSIVLGAWGRGAFGNDGAEVARLSGRAMQDARRETPGRDLSAERRANAHEV